MMRSRSFFEAGKGAPPLLSVFLFFSLLLAASSSFATLSETDFANPGDNLLLYDSASNLEWLDLTMTVGLSDDDLVTGADPIDFINSLGFRLATTAEVGDLWVHAGITDTSGVSTTANFAGVQFLLTTMGCTANCLSAGLTNQGQSEFDSDSPDLNGPFLSLMENGEAVASLHPIFSQPRNFSSPTLGNYLVRPSIAPVPEPSTALLLGLGVATLSSLRQRRGRITID